MQGAPHTHTHTIGAVKRKGFTIIQLVIGMLIFAILTGIAFFGISIYTAQANETRVASDLGTFEVAIKDYMLNNPGACSDGTLNPVGLNHYLTKENTLALDEADPNKDDLGTEISVAAGVKDEVAYKKLSVLEDPWGHQYRVVIRNNADRTTEEGEYGAKGTDRAFIYVYSMGKDGKGAANDTKQDDSVLCVQYSDGEVYSRSYLPSDGKNQAVTAPAYTYWNKDENGKHSVMKDSIFAVGGADPSKAPGKENSGSGDGSGGEAGSIIPGGAAYTKADGTTSTGDGTSKFPDVPKTGDKYEDADYVYTYNKGKDCSSISEWWEADFGDEWSVVVKDKTKTSYGEIASEIAGKPVTHMTETFADCSSLTAAPKIPSGVANMDATFWCCTSLVSAPVIPSSVEYMPETFASCTSLAVAPEIPCGVTNMTSVFNNCTSLKTYVGSKDEDGNFSNYILPSGVTSVRGAFLACTPITTAPAIPVGVTDMYAAFEECTSLVTAPAIPSNVTDMGRTFRGCTSLNTVPAIPGSVTDMGGTFEGCTSLTTAPVIPYSVTNISAAFKDCTSLEVAPIIPSGVKSMGDPYQSANGVFENCISLKTYVGSIDPDGDFSKYVIPDTVANMNSAFSGCHIITVAPTIPNGVTQMWNTFGECESLRGQTITIPTSVTGPGTTSGTWTNGPSWVKR